MDTPAHVAAQKIAAHAASELRTRAEARAQELDAQAEAVRRQAELEMTALRTAAAELRALFAEPATA